MELDDKCATIVPLVLHTTIFIIARHLKSISGNTSENVLLGTM